MTLPEGSLTPTQHEIMEAVWECGEQGAAVTEIWRAVAAQRQVGRTTVLNLVDRLEKRGWLVRGGDRKPYRYVAALGRQQTAALLAGGFVDDFFGGSAGNLVMSLLGAQRLKPEEIERLQNLLRSAGERKINPRKKGK
ncbi:MAG: BlaI/MecI/CopY family transcriptional regulator [Pirellulales bacterium]|nr:BlaI/MecI/CopY family transcriptional regulator [Pirellulales bacterium]